jgi:hypothetical protein
MPRLLLKVKYIVERGDVKKPPEGGCLSYKRGHEVSAVGVRRRKDTD